MTPKELERMAQLRSQPLNINEAVELDLLRDKYHTELVKERAHKRYLNKKQEVRP
jgi:hypothetical protein